MTAFRAVLFVMTVSLLNPSTAPAFQCKVCHSKNPKMVAMHRAAEGQNCFECHKVGEKLMGKSQPKDRDSLLKRRSDEAVCRPCHGRKE